MITAAYVSGREPGPTMTSFVMNIFNSYYWTRRIVEYFINSVQGGSPNMLKALRNLSSTLEQNDIDLGQSSFFLE